MRMFQCWLTKNHQSADIGVYELQVLAYLVYHRGPQKMFHLLVNNYRY